MRILIVKSSSLGDIIHAFPVINYLKHRFPRSVIDWVVEKPFAEILEAHPLIENVLKINTKTWRREWWKKKTWTDFFHFRRSLREHDYDLVVDLQGNTKSALVTCISRSMTKVGFGWQSVSEKPNIFFTTHRYNPKPGCNIRDDYLNLLQQHYDDTHSFISQGTLLHLNEKDKDNVDIVLSHPLLRNQRKVMVCPGSHWKNKQLKIETLIDFLALLQPHLDCRFVLVWGSKEEQKAVNFIHRQFKDYSIILDRISIPLLQNIMAGMHTVIAVDSLPLHLAGTANVPTFSIFGPSLASKYKPLGVLHQAWQGPCPYNRTFTKRCPVLRTCPTGNCIQNADAHTLFDAFIKLLS